MFARFAALSMLMAAAGGGALAAAIPTAPSIDKDEAVALSSSAPWWEKLMVTVGAEGETIGCRYQTSLQPGATKPCEVSGGNEAAASGDTMSEQLTHITFERRFTPDATTDDTAIGTGDTLLGKSVLALAIDGQGRVRGCKVVATGGSKPDYGCAEAQAEKFEAGVTRAPGRPLRVATLTILIYAHEENHV